MIVGTGQQQRIGMNLRGEPAPTLRDVLELVLAPIYLHALFIGSTQALGGVERLIDRALAT